ncbi:hypothetical protein L484_027453 [Morus notabilis]|uniref:Uncharacterized protein n=1 Tax=Morus notabilis TaxID=981085 RepID=W9S8Q1_9ROSA|nr:hypothetical protein L484_027453 [Morus notabilis]
MGKKPNGVTLLVSRVPLERQKKRTRAVLGAFRHGMSQIRETWPPYCKYVWLLRQRFGYLFTGNRSPNPYLG